MRWMKTGGRAPGVVGPRLRPVTAAAAAGLLVVAAGSVVRIGRHHAPTRSAPVAAAGVVSPPPAAPPGGGPPAYVGYLYPQTPSGGEYPLGVVHIGDGLLGPAGAQFGWAEVRSGSVEMLWFQRFLDPVGAGRRVEVVDAADAGPAADGYQLLVGRCRYGTGKLDPEIAAMTHFAEEDDAEDADAAEADERKEEADRPEADAEQGVDEALPFSSDIRAAWRLDRASGRVEPADPSGLSCQSRGD